MSTGLVREEVLDCLGTQLRQFGSLIRGLTETEWSLPTRCTGWTVHNVCAHVAGNLTDIAEGRLRDLGSDEATSRQVENRRHELRDRILDEFDRSSAAVVHALATFDDTAWSAPSAVAGDGTMGEDVEALMSDTYVHTLDVLAAVERPPDRGPGLYVTVLHLADLLQRRGWGPAILGLDGLHEILVENPDRPSSRPTRRVAADPHAFVLVATGRLDADELGLDSTVNTYR